MSIAPVIWGGLAILGALVVVALVSDRRDALRYRQIRRDAPPTRELPLSGLVIHPEQEKHAAWLASRLRETRADMPRAERQRCDRCRNSNPKLPCGCGSDCYAVDCLGGLA